MTPFALASPFSVSRLRLRLGGHREDQFVGIVERGDRLPQAPLAPFEPDELDLGAGELAIRAEQCRSRRAGWPHASAIDAFSSRRRSRPWP